MIRIAFLQQILRSGGNTCTLIFGPPYTNLALLIYDPGTGILLARYWIASGARLMPVLSRKP